MLENIKWALSLFTLSTLVAATTPPPFASADHPKLCAGIRGNGNLVFAHFTSLARLVEQYGVIDGLAGGSSASLTLFLYESILDNPAVWNCKGEPCSNEDSAKRISLLLKAITPAFGQLIPAETKALLGSASEGDEMLKLKTWLRDGMPYFRLRLIRRIADRKGEQVFREALSKLETMPGSEYINREIKRKLWAYLHRMPEAERHEISKAIDTMDFTFDGKDIGILFRNGIVDMPAVVATFGTVGDFFAGRDLKLASAFQSFVDGCASAHAGQLWSDFDKVPVLKSCAANFQTLFSAFLQERKRTPIAHPRLQDGVGTRLNLLIANAVLVGDSVGRFQKADQSYHAQLARNQTPKLDFSINFRKDIRAGYWGRMQSLRQIEASALGSKDLKTQKFMALGPTTWQWALERSAAEPGLARAFVQGSNKNISEPTVSIAGWLDLHPSPVLKHMGCEKTVLITREFPTDNEFAGELSSLFGITAEEQNALFGFDNPESSFNQSLKLADAIWCTRWNYFQRPDQIKDLLKDAYFAPIVTQAPFFLGAPNVLPKGEVKPGCTPK